ncbi:hypothetical protein SAY87_010053 [Trapa incisa]|uniref:Uncharacterized protein n=1 Tax=Trapa incisa TaxID=236973 RepID=A0AAN7GE17_9MYRT|nr:hypothetical protein SAY87_010053 [Trapa incisa]
MRLGALRMPKFGLLVLNVFPVRMQHLDQEGDVEGAHKVLDEMPTLEHWVRLYMFDQEEEVEGAQKVLDEMPTLEHWVRFYMFDQEEEVEGAHKVLDEMPTLEHWVRFYMWPFALSFLHRGPISYTFLMDECCNWGTCSLESRSRLIARRRKCMRHSTCWRICFKRIACRPWLSVQSYPLSVHCRKDQFCGYMLIKGFCGAGMMKEA